MKSGQSKIQNPESTDGLLKAIIAGLSAVPCRRMRSHLLAEKIRQLTASQAAGLLQEIVLGDACRDRGDCCLLLDALDVPLLTGFLGNPIMSDIYTAAQEQGFEALATFLSRHEASRSAEAEPEPQDVPSGVRLSRAKQLQGPQLARMFADADPRVIRAVLNNPSLTESGVLQLCSRRPALAAVQQEVMSSKWSASYRVKKALLFNPYTPTGLGLKLVHFLMLQDLRLVAESLDLHPEIRAIARRKIRDRGEE